MKITGETKLYGLIGYPVKHSLSPVMQNAAFEACGLNSVYIPLRVPPSSLKDAVDGLRAIDIGGFNVTIPHKVSVIRCLDGLDPSAAMLGAVNTVVNRNGKLIGYNTDGAGALEALRKANVNVEGLNVVILGAGGAARAIAYS
ncbi:MAG: shikimate dehydrogenase, partial [Nitrososphaerota archaeon]